MQKSLADVLSEYVQRAHYSSGKLAKMTGLSRKTINNWLNGRVSKPQQWQGLAMLAAVLHLTEPQTNHLFQSAHHPTVAKLWQTVTTAGDIALLTPWPPKTAVPFQAIFDVPYFVGREEVLAELTKSLQQGEFVNVCNVWGMGGVGKTAVAARLAYQLQPYFPDGVLWANLANSDTMAILGQFAQAFGENVNQLTDEDSRSAYVRGILAHKRVLIILDDAQTNKQLTLLFPPRTGKTAVIITTRHDLPAADGLKRVEIKPFRSESGDSLALFANFLGKQKVYQNQTTLMEIATLLGHLPLAIAIAAARLAYAPGYTIDDFLSQIRQQNRRLDQLTRGEDRSVRLSFDISYHALPSHLQEFFTILGTFGGESFSMEAVAAVTQSPLETATTKLYELTRLSLVSQDTNHRYSLHPLLRDYAHEKITQKEIWARTIDYFITYVQVNEFNFSALEVETNNILAALQTAFSQNLVTSILEGTHVFYPFLEMRGLHKLAEQHLNQALQIANSHSDSIGAALILSDLAHLAYIQSDYRQAETYIYSGMNLMKQTTSPDIQGRFLYRLASINIDRGNLHQAETQLLEALLLTRQSGDLRTLSDIFGQLSKVVAISRGDFAQVETYLQDGYALAQQLNDQNRITTFLTLFGALAYHRGLWQQAEAYLQQGLALSRKIGHLRMETNQLQSLGALAQSQGELAQAETYLQSALLIAEKIDLNEAIPVLLASLGEITLEQGKLDTAETYFQQAVAVAREFKHPANLSFALANLGAVALKKKNYLQAEDYLREGVELAFKGGQLWDKFTALRWLGELRLAQKAFDQARIAWNQARGLAEETNTQELSGIILFQLARLEQVQGNLAEATRLAHSSKKILQELGHYLHNQVETWLGSISS